MHFLILKNKGLRAVDLMTGSPGMESSGEKSVSNTKPNGASTGNKIFRGTRHQLRLV
jgi:hypothetical protein